MYTKERNERTDLTSPDSLANGTRLKEPVNQLKLDFRGVKRIQTSKNAMVTTDHGDCSDLGGEILNAGGNAFDAAVTVTLCIGLLAPQSSGIGGGGFILMKHQNGTIYAIDSREPSPLGSTPTMFANTAGDLAALLKGISIGVPLELKGLELMWRNFGTMPWKNLVEPVIPFAEYGFAATWELVDRLQKLRPLLGSEKFVERLKTFLVEEDGEWRIPYLQESCCRRPALAKTLRLVAEKGVDELYSSEWGEDLVNDVQNFDDPGILVKEDLINAKPKFVKPIKSELFGFDVYTMPPESSGVVTLMGLKLLDSYDVSSDETLNYHRLIETMKHAFAVRTHIGDPGDDNEWLDLDQLLEDILTDEFIEELRNGTRDDTIQEREAYGGRYGVASEVIKDSGTSHSVLVDSMGNVVSLTSSVNGPFGSALVSEKTGVLLNNQMGDFGSPSEEAYANVTGKKLINDPLPGRRPLSSMSPTFFIKDGEVSLAGGAVGGPTIILSQLQVYYRYFKLKMDLTEAIRAPRLFDFFSGDSLYEDVQIGDADFVVDEKLLASLEELGHVFKPQQFLSRVFVVERLKSGEWRGIPDPRGGGASASNI